MSWFVACIAGFIVTALAVVALRPLAVAIQLIDKPGGRKTHQGDIPVVGGIAMFIGVVVAMGLLRTYAFPEGALSAAFGLLVLVGLLDDRFNLSPWLRLPVHFGVALLLFNLADCRIESIGNAFGLGELRLAEGWHWLVTALFIAAGINAFNMLDGMDGLAGTTAGVSFMAMAFAAGRSGDIEVVAYCAVMISVICGFLLFNLPVPGRRLLRCFMGDAGSTLLGVAVAYSMIRLTQGVDGFPVSMHPVTALWIAGLPLFELIWSFVRRVMRGGSPFTGDAEHFHHLLQRAGFGVRGAFIMLLALAVVLSVAGLLLQYLGASEYVSLVALVVVGIVVVRSMYGISWLLPYVPAVMRHAQQVEQR